MAEIILYDHHGRPIVIRDDPRPLIEPITSHGEPVELVKLQSTDIISGSQFANFQPDFAGTAMVWFAVNTPGVSGVLSLNVYTIGGTQVNTTGWLIDGMTIGVGDWKPIMVPIGKKYVYALSFSAACNVTVQVIGEPRLVAPGQSTVTAQLSGSTVTQTTMQNAATGTGNGTAMAVTGMMGATFDVTLTGGTATITIKDNNGNTLPVYASSGAQQLAIAASGYYECPFAGRTSVTAVIGSISGATVTVVGSAIPSSFGGVDSSSNTAIQQPVDIQGVLDTVIANLVNFSATLNTNILSSNYEYATAYVGAMNSELSFCASVPGVLSVEIDGVAWALNNGNALVSGAGYSFDVPIVFNSTYNLQYSASATVQVKWIAGVI